MVLCSRDEYKMGHLSSSNAQPIVTARALDSALQDWSVSTECQLKCVDRWIQDFRKN
jgi:hypothetical protein